MIADAGLPTPKGVEVIDLSVVRGIPQFMDVLRAVKDELVIESFIYASKLPEKNKALYEQMDETLKDLLKESVPHEEFKKIMKDARIVVRTGECSSFANVILVAGVNF